MTFLIAIGAFLLYGLVLFTWCFAMFDMFARPDLSFIAKIIWLLAIIFIPLLGVLFYFITRPRDVAWFGYGYDETKLSLRDQEIGEIETLSRLRSQGTITEVEFDQMKQRVLARAA